MTVGIDVTVAVWHAYAALDEHKNGQVPKSKLKVFTASIGTLLGYKNAEEGLNDHRSTSWLNFDDFMYYINKELLSFAPGSLEQKDIKKYQSHIEELSWLVCRNVYLTRDLIVFPDSSVYQLFRIFCMLAQLVRTTDGGTSTSEVVMVADEVEHVAQNFVRALGTQTSWDSADFSQIAQVLPTFRFSVFLALLETHYAKNIPLPGLVEATQEIHDLFVEDVLKKGSLLKKIKVVGKLKEHWFVLQPSALSWYSNREESDKKGEISLNSKSIVEPCNETNSRNHLFQLTSDDKKFELYALDFKSKSQWISALRLAIKESQNKISYQRILAQRRKSEREAILQKKMEEDRKEEQNRLQMAQKQAQLEAEILSRKEAEKRMELEKASKYLIEKEKKILEESKLKLVQKLKTVDESQEEQVKHKLAKKQEELQAEIQSRKEAEKQLGNEKESRMELEAEKNKLAKQLEDEKQATRDEEIVRALQARMLNEEWQKIENLENKLLELQEMINTEREEKEKLEEEKLKQSLSFNNFQNRMKRLEADKNQYERQLKDMKDKVTIAERAKDILEAKLKVRERDLQQVNTNGQITNNNKNLVCSR